jgi:hypothetical protein
VSERQQILVPGTHATLALLQTDSEPDPRNLQWLVATGRPCGFPRYFARVRSQLASYQFFPLLNRGTAGAFRSSRADRGAQVLPPAGGDRVKCDVRYQELKIPPDEYQAFKRKCMGEKYSDND